MEKKCDECYKTFNEYSTYRICLKCHSFVCIICQSKHSGNNSGHNFRFPLLHTFSYNTTCRQHYTDNDTICIDCNESICSTCLPVTNLHKRHTTRLINQLVNDQKQEVASEIIRIEKSNEKVQTQLDPRERNFDQFIKKANDIQLDLDQEFKWINDLVSERRLYLKSCFKSQQNEDLCSFLSEIRSLKAAIEINKELKKNLKQLFENAENNKKGFLTGYAEFRKYSEKLVTYPKAVGDEFLSMEIDYQKSTDEEIKKVLPRICIGSTHDISRARRKGEEENDTSKVDSTRTQTDTKEKDKQITDLQDKLRFTCKVIEVISENVMRLANASSSTDGQCSISLEPLGNLPTHLNMDTQIDNIHLSMEKIKRNIQKKNMLFKTTKDKTKEQDESTKGREIKSESTAEVHKVHDLQKHIAELENRLKTPDALVKEQEKRSDELKGVPRTDVLDLKKQISLLENRLKTSDAQAKEQEECIRREQLEKSAVEIQKWKQKVVEIQDRLKTSDAQAKEQEECIRREQLEKSAVEIQKWKQKVVEIQDRLKTSDAQAKEQEECIRREQLEKSAVEIQKWKQNVVEIQDRYETICKQHETLKLGLKRSEEEKENLMTRLSQVAGAKLTAGNSSIADLGDKYRPTRISDLFAEMYDSEWTDVMDDILETHKEWTEELVVRHIFIVLQECFRACKGIATDQMKKLCEDMYFSPPTQDLRNYVEAHVTEIKQLQDARKGTAPFVGKILKEKIFGTSTFMQNCRRYKEINTTLVKRIIGSEFGQKCVAICWFMVVQDPEMYIDGDLKPGIQFDKEVYKEYTRSGKRVAFSVWPALYLHKDGPLLTKGVAQPCD